VVYAAGVDYAARKPRLGFLPFLAYYATEHLAYQTGVVAGCVKERTFRSYLPVFWGDAAATRSMVPDVAKGAGLQPRVSDSQGGR